MPIFISYHFKSRRINNAIYRVAVSSASNGTYPIRLDIESSDDVWTMPIGGSYRRQPGTPECHSRVGLAPAQKLTSSNGVQSKEEH